VLGNSVILVDRGTLLSMGEWNFFWGDEIGAVKWHVVATWGFSVKWGWLE